MVYVWLTFLLAGIAYRADSSKGAGGRRTARFLHQALVRGGFDGLKQLWKVDGRSGLHRGRRYHLWSVLSSITLVCVVHLIIELIKADHISLELQHLHL